jgi:hypothetical protein
MNFRDLKSLKCKALTENNFDAHENFVEYETYLKNSYFSVLLKEI